MLNRRQLYRLTVKKNDKIIYANPNKKKKVHFNNCVKVVLIPCIKDYQYLGIKEDLWYNYHFLTKS